MASTQRYIVCTRRPGSPRVAEEVCRACAKKHRCEAWRRFQNPPLFRDLYGNPRGS